jgi:flagellar M-ring protein FliF
MVPDLSPSEVTVFDQSNGISYTADSADDPFDSRLVQRVREFTREYETKIRSALEYIPEVMVTVHVDVENLKSSVVRRQTIDPKKSTPLYQNEQTTTDSSRQQTSRGEAGYVPNRPASLATQSGPERTRELSESQTNTVNAASFEVSEQELIAAMPRAVQVSISIPKDYYRGVALRNDPANASLEKAKLDPLLKTIETEVLATVKQTASVLIPADSPPEAISVHSVDVLEPETVLPAVPMTETIGRALTQWGGAIGIGLFALCALWLLNRSTPKLPQEEPPELGLPSLAFAPPEIEPPTPVLSENEQRESIQSMVRDNPEVAASVLSKWIQAAK